MSSRRMRSLTQTERLLAPAEGAHYTVQTVAIPVPGLCVPQDLIERFNVPADQAERLQQRAAAAAQPGTFLVPLAWTGAAVLVICGSGDNRHAFKWLLFRKLLDRGIAVLTVDPPGHGEFLQAPCTLDNTRRAARAASDWLHAQPGVTRVGALGIRFGGCQAADVAAHDQRIAAVALIATPVELPPVTRSTFALEAAGLLLPRNVALLRHQSLRKMWAEWQSMTGSRAWFGESLYDMIVRYDVLGAMRQIGARPTLFVHGALDRAVPAANARRMYDATGDKRELIVARQGTHLSIVLFDREMTQVADWLAGNLVTSGRHGQSA
jgi:pimeloyl-ACP methyl ester carboxylesterase